MLRYVHTFFRFPTRPITISRQTIVWIVLLCLEGRLFYRCKYLPFNMMVRRSTCFLNQTLQQLEESSGPKLLVYWQQASTSRPSMGFLQQGHKSNVLMGSLIPLVLLHPAYIGHMIRKNIERKKHGTLQGDRLCMHELQANLLGIILWWGDVCWMNDISLVQPPLQLAHAMCGFSSHMIV